MDELHQLIVPRRSGADVGDLLADALGAALGLAAVALIYARYFREDQPAPAAA
jgi:VanZ family protein